VNHPPHVRVVKSHPQSRCRRHHRLLAVVALVGEVVAQIAGPPNPTSLIHLGGCFDDLQIISLIFPGRSSPHPFKGGFPVGPSPNGGMQGQDLDGFVLDVDAFDGVAIAVFVGIVTALSLKGR
jgi:hypothetical protein